MNGFGGKHTRLLRRERPLRAHLASRRRSAPARWPGSSPRRPGGAGPARTATAPAWTPAAPAAPRSRRTTSPTRVPKRGRVRPGRRQGAEVRRLLAALCAACAAAIARRVRSGRPRRSADTYRVDAIFDTREGRHPRPAGQDRRRPRGHDRRRHAHPGLQGAHRDDGAARVHLPHRRVVRHPARGADLGELRPVRPGHAVQAGARGPRRAPAHRAGRAHVGPGEPHGPLPDLPGRRPPAVHRRDRGARRRAGRPRGRPQRGAPAGEPDAAGGPPAHPRTGRPARPAAQRRRGHRPRDRRARPRPRPGDALHRRDRRADAQDGGPARRARRLDPPPPRPARRHAAGRARPRPLRRPRAAAARPAAGGDAVGAAPARPGRAVQRDGAAGAAPARVVREDGDPRRPAHGAHHEPPRDAERAAAQGRPPPRHDARGPPRPWVRREPRPVRLLRRLGPGPLRLRVAHLRVAPRGGRLLDLRDHAGEGLQRLLRRGPGRPPRAPPGRAATATPAPAAATASPARTAPDDGPLRTLHDLADFLLGP